MIGRADIEGSKSNVAMIAWLPQVSSIVPCSASHFLLASLHLQLQSLLSSLHCSHVSMGGRSYLRIISTKWIVNRTPHLTDRWDAQLFTALSPADCPYLADYYQNFTEFLTWRCYLQTLGTANLTGVPSNQVCCLHSLSPSETALTSHECELPLPRASWLGLITLIPVVTFLAPLA